MKKVIPLVATALTIFGNFYIPRLNGQSVGQNPGNIILEAQPAGFTFSIWSFIYSALIYLSYKIYKQDIIWSNSSILLYLVSCSFNLLWIYNWTQNKPEISQYLLFGLVISLYLLWRENVGNLNMVIYQNIISSYLAWTIGASLLNVFIVNGEGNNFSGSKIVIYLISTIQILWQIINRNNVNELKESLLIPLTGVWTGIGISFNNSTVLGFLKYLPLIVSLIASINHYNNISRLN